MLGKIIKKYLDANGVKQTFLAQKLGIPDSAVSDMLNGKRNIMATEYYLICKALGVSTDLFFEDVEAE